MPAVSIIIPAYEAYETLPAALASVIDQSFTDWAAYVIDDGSRQGEFYASACAQDARIALIRQANGGPSIARNQGILASISPYIAFLDADDLWSPNKLAEQVACLEQDPGCVLCYTDFSKGPDHQNPTSRLAAYQPRTRGREFHDLLRENFILTSSVVVRRSAFACSGLFDPSLKGPEDLDLWLRLARIGAFAWVDKVLAHKRDHEANLSSSISFHRNQIAMLEYWQTRAGDDPTALKLIRDRLRQAWYSRAYSAKSQGWLEEARSAYVQTARLGFHPFKNYLIAGVLSLPRSVVGPLLRCTRERSAARDSLASSEPKAGVLSVRSMPQLSVMSRSRFPVRSKD